MRSTTDPMLQFYVSHLSAQGADAMAATVAALRAQRPPAAGYPPVTAAPVRRCETCQQRAWEWTEPEAGAGR
jgi:hypothetical protein